MGSAGASSGTIGKTASDVNSEDSVYIDSGRASSWIHRSMSAIPRSTTQIDSDDPRPMQRSSSQNSDLSALATSRGMHRTTVNFEATNRSQHVGDPAVDIASTGGSLTVTKRMSSTLRLRTSGGRKGIASTADLLSSTSVSLRLPPSMTGLANSMTAAEGSGGVRTSSLVGNGDVLAASGVLLEPQNASNFQLLPFASVGTHGSNDSSSGAYYSREGGISTKTGQQEPQRPASSAPKSHDLKSSGTIESSGGFAVFGERVPKQGAGVYCHEITARMIPNVFGHG